MRRFSTTVFSLTIALATVRAGLFLAHSVTLFGDPLEAFYLESKMVHLAWRAGSGSDVPLYPQYRQGPIHVTNFFSPLYFLIVGWGGQLVGADLEGLTRIGRAVSILMGMLAAVLVGVVTRRRYGNRAGWLAGVLSLGPAPMVHFGAMVRPDVMADLLGFAGFVLAVGWPLRERSRHAGASEPGDRRGIRRFWWAGAVLVAAVMTKQTAGVYLIASVLGLVVLGRWRAALGLTIGTSSAMVMIVGIVTATVEPFFYDGLVGEMANVTEFSNWFFFLVQLCIRAPDLPFFAMVGLVLWTFRTPRAPEMAVLAVVVTGVEVLTALKIGSDLNYYLGLRLVAAMGAGALWRTIEESLDAERWGRLIGKLALATIGAILIVPGAIDVGRFLIEARTEARDLASDRGQATLAAYRALFSMAEDPDVAMLTDSGLIALRQRDRAPFVDPWLFRVLVFLNQVRPEAIRTRILAGDYDLIVSTTDLTEPSALVNSFVLPPPLIVAIDLSYLPAFTIAPDDSELSLYVYIPRFPRSPPPPALDEARRLASRTAGTAERHNPN